MEALPGRRPGAERVARQRPDRLRARVYGLTFRQRLTRLVLPAASPQIAAGLTLGLVYAWVATIGAEFLLANWGHGLGNLIIKARASFNVELIVVGMLAIGLIGTALNRAAARVEASRAAFGVRRMEEAMARRIQIRSLGKQYTVDGRPLTALDDVSLDIRPGEFVSIVGASGGGKSTLLRLLIGLESPMHGEILLDGQRAEGTSLDRGIVFQEHRLFPWLDVERNIGLIGTGARATIATSVGVSSPVVPPRASSRLRASSVGHRKVMLAQTIHLGLHRPAGKGPAG